MPVETELQVPDNQVVAAVQVQAAPEMVMLLLERLVGLQNPLMADQEVMGFLLLLTFYFALQAYIVTPLL